MRNFVQRIGGFLALVLFVALLGNDSLLKGQTNTVPPNTVPPNRTPASGPVVQATGRTTQSPPLIPNNIPISGGPGGAAQPVNPPQNQPGRPQQVLPNNGQPFPQLTVAEAADLDRLLDIWEKRSSQFRYFETEFQLWKYGEDLLNQAESVSYGKIQYSAPNKGMYEITGLIVDGKRQPAPPENRTRFLSTGDQIYDYDFVKKHVRIYTIPEDQREGIAGGGPMPFVFGAKADDLKKRYYLRILRPKEREGKGEIWLEAFPRTPEDADEFKSIQLVFDAKQLTPKAFIKFGVNEKERDTYQFLENTMVVRAKGSPIPDPPFAQRDIPIGWTKEEIEPPPQVAHQTPRPAPVQPRVAAPPEVQETELYTPPQTQPKPPQGGGSRPQF